MEKKRCQVCDGPVVNGRCKLCGMPYKNDETLYHLNENRSDHYRHATSKARAIMRQEEIPLGDQKAGNTVSGRKSTAGSKSTGSSYGKNTAGSKSTGSSYGKSTAGSKSTGSNYGKSTAGSKNTGASYRTTTVNNKPAGTNYKKKNHIFRWLLLLIIICIWVPEIRNFIQDAVMEELNDNFGTGFDVASPMSYEMESTDIWEAGSDIEPGYYVASCENGSITFLIQGTDGETGTMSVSEYMERKITLNEGDWIGIVSAEPDDAVLLLTQRED